MNQFQINNDLVVFKFNNIEIPFNLSSGPDNIMVEVTKMAKAYGKKIAEWRRLPSTKRLIKILKENNINVIIVSSKGRYSSCTKLSELLVIDFIKWIGDPVLLNFIINSIIKYKIGFLPEKAKIYEEDFLDFYCKFLEIVNNKYEVLSYFEEPLINQLNKPIHIKNIGEKTYFYFPINNTVFKLSKEDILNVVSSIDSINILETVGYLDTILEKSDFNYLKLKYLELDNILFKNSLNSGINQKTYLMRDSNTGLIKIGKAVDPKFRERTLQSEKPTISLFAVCDNLVERELHKKYNDKRVRGEWFKLGEDEVSKIITTYNFKNKQ